MLVGLVREYLRNMRTGEIYKREKCSEGKLKNIRGTNFEVRHPLCVGSITKFFLCFTHTVEHNCISPSSTVGIQLHGTHY